MFNCFKPYFVKFKDGSFGICTNTLFDKRYQDFTNKKYRWGLNSQFIGSCRTTKENAEQFLQVRLDEGTRV